jgi:hypothetical protein
VIGLDVGYVGEPGLVCCRRIDVPFEQVRGKWRLLPVVRTRHGFTMMARIP